MTQLKSNKGFTLIELVVVIAILGILAGIAIPRFMDATATARGSRIVADMRTIDSAVMLYQAKTGGIPTGSAELTKTSSANGNTVEAVLASWPTPPKGKATVDAKTGEKNKTIDAEVYVLNTTVGAAHYGRAELGAGGKTCDEILSAGF